MNNASISSHLFIIFGATGDLTHRKLLPALYRLMQREDVSEKCYVLGTSRSKWDDDTFRKHAHESLQEHGFSEEDLAEWCDTHLFFHSLSEDEGDFATLSSRVEAVESECNIPGNRIFYLALPPSVYGPVTETIGEAGLHKSRGWTRLVIEKPFGFDTKSARKLNDLVHRYFDEDQIYRIDHFLGKETVQNLLAFRFGNALFEAVWNRDRIERVEITVSETLGLEGRASYYDQAGHLRDMVQNHLTQIFTLVAMEPPSAFRADAIRLEKNKVLESVRPIDPKDVIFGQYTAGSINGQTVPAYRNEEGLTGASMTETFVALKLEVANWRWQGVPFYLRSGKRLPRSVRQVAVHFRRPPVSLFGPEEIASTRASNLLLITIQPDEGFDLRFQVKMPGAGFHLQPQQLKFRYEDAFGSMPDAYETLLLDVITGDQTLFVHADEVLNAWRLFTPLLEREQPIHPYTAGTWGPAATETLLTEWTNNPL